MNYYLKYECLEKDWKNKKTISNEEIAYCIQTHKIDLDLIPKERLSAVTKILTKLKTQAQEAAERKLIEAELAVHKSIGTEKLFGNNGIEVAKFSDEVIEYQLDPTLFETHFEAVTALAELSSCWNHEITKTEEYDHKYKNTDTYGKDLKRMKTAMEKVKQRYIKLGGNAKTFDRGRDQIPMPQLGTLKQDVDANRERITKNFISIGVPPTRANEIAIAITTQVYFAL